MSATLFEKDDFLPEESAEPRKYSQIYPVCDCITKINAQLPSDEWVRRKQIYDMQTGRIAKTGVMVAIEVGSNRRRKVTELLATFCPFCGKAYNDQFPSASAETEVAS